MNLAQIVEIRSHGTIDPGWIGVDLDGTLARFKGWEAPDVIGAPIPKMVARVKAWLKQGKDVRIFTARISVGDGTTKQDAEKAKKAIDKFCLKVFGKKLSVTNQKSHTMVELWDDLAHGVQTNTGRRVK